MDAIVSVDGSGRLLTWSGPDGEVLGREGNRYLNRMADSTMYMQQLIHDLIDLSRVGRSGVEPIEVDLRRHRDGAGHLPHDRRGAGRRHRHRGRPRDRRPHRAPSRRRSRWPSHQLTAGSMR